MNLNSVAALLSKGGKIHPDITGVCIDTRSLAPGNLFIAIKGENFDGHDFVHEAKEKGALGVVVERVIEGVQIAQFVVSDTIQALAQLAAQHRQTMHCPVIALTGSNGKTTVKEMISAILPTPSHASKGNFNNHIGAPLSVLELNSQHRYAVFELGANHPGEIAHTVAIVRPDITLINNIAQAHIEGFGSLDGVAHAKGEIHKGLSEDGIAIVNDDDSYAHFWDELLSGKKVLRYSTTHPSDLYAQDIRFDTHGRGQFSLILPKGREDIELQVPGLHNIQNALAAAACCYAAGISIKDIKNGLNRFNGVKGRMTFLVGKNQSTIIDDTYNANLRSVLTALEVLAKRPGEKIVVFGDMGELGVWAPKHHEEVGLAAHQLGINRLLTCGKHSALATKAFGEGAMHFASQEELAQKLIPDLSIYTTVLVKGSRSSAMEKIVQKLLN